MSDASPQPRQSRRRCRVDGCPDRQWHTIPPGVPVVPDDHPDSHYSMYHADPADVSPRSRFRPDGTRKW